MKTILNSAQETQRFGGWLASRLKTGQVISLEGPLGAGKTTLLQGLADGLGVKENQSSPTFILFRALPVIGADKPKVDKKIEWLVHGDAYRLTRPQEMIEAGLQDYLDDQTTVSVIEWGDKLKDILPKNALRISFEYLKGEQNKRQITWPDEFGKPPHNWYKNSNVT